MSRMKDPRITRLYRVLIERNISQRKMAQLTGLSTDRLSRLCRGRYEATPEEQRAIAGVLGLPVEQLFDPLAGMEPDAAVVERLVAFLHSPEGNLLVARLLAALEGE